MTVFRTAIIGTGAFASYHVQALRSVGSRVDLLASVSPDAEKGQAFCQTHGIPQFFTSTVTMLETIRPDLVLICTPPHTHAELSIQALQAGAHVLCEKPLCSSLAEFDHLQAVAHKAGRTLSNVFQWRFGSGAQTLKTLIESGQLGKCLLATCQTLWYRDAEYYGTPWRSARETALGGTTTGHGIHLMDLMLWLLPDWVSVHGIVTTLAQPITVDNLSIAQVRFADGALGTISNSAISTRQETHLRLDFEKGTIEVKGLYSAKNANWTFTPAPNIDPDLWSPQIDVEGLLDAQVHALLDDLEQGKTPLVSGEEARRIIEFLTCFYQSAHTGKTIHRGSITPEDPFYHHMQGIR